MRITLVLAGLLVTLAITASAWLAGTGGASAGLTGRTVHPQPAQAAGRGTGPGEASHAVLTAEAAGASQASQGALAGTPRQIAWELIVHRFHWRSWQFKYLDKLWTLESGWNQYASNPYSGAYGIPQAVPGSRMATAGPHWRSDARTQIRWGLLYIQERYHTPYWAWRYERNYGWY
ncbi:MAG TPA: lytic transglycosylase domain-containing protein [Streptosporangiaceae bacterium]